MTRLKATATVGSEFDDFPHAPIVVECAGTVLSAPSALARLTIDPWDEATRLARVPYEFATVSLMKLIAALPNGLSEGLDAGALARELVALLPRRGATRDPSPRRAAVARNKGDRSAGTTWLVLYLVLTMILLGAQWLVGPLREALGPGAAAPPQTSGPTGAPPRN